MATIDVPPIVVTLKMSKAEADALYFLLINMPRGGTYIEQLQHVLACLESYRKTLYGP